jgi:hypothetical protein
MTSFIGPAAVEAPVRDSHRVSATGIRRQKKTEMTLDPMFRPSVICLTSAALSCDAVIRQSGQMEVPLSP